MSGILKKGDYITNPETKRPIKVGGRVFLRLVKRGILEGNYEDGNELYVLGDDEIKNVEEIKQKYTKNMSKGTHAVRGRGRYENKIVPRHKRLKKAKYEEDEADLIRMILAQQQEEEEEEDSYSDSYSEGEEYY